MASWSCLWISTGLLALLDYESSARLLISHLYQIRAQLVTPSLPHGSHSSPRLGHRGGGQTVSQLACKGEHCYVTLYLLLHVIERRIQVWRRWLSTSVQFSSIHLKLRSSWYHSVSDDGVYFIRNCAATTTDWVAGVQSCESMCPHVKSPGIPLPPPDPYFRCQNLGSTLLLTVF